MAFKTRIRKPSVHLRGSRTGDASELWSMDRALVSEQVDSFMAGNQRQIERARQMGKHIQSGPTDAPCGSENRNSGRFCYRHGFHKVSDSQGLGDCCRAAQPAASSNSYRPKQQNFRVRKRIPQRQTLLNRCLGCIIQGCGIPWVSNPRPPFFLARTEYLRWLTTPNPIDAQTPVETPNRATPG